MKYIEVLDSSLRDGAQGEGISFSVEDKLAIVRELDRLGIPLIECGNPGSNPKDLAFFERVKCMGFSHARLTAFGSTRRKDSRVEEDENLRALLNAGTETVVIFGKASKFHIESVLCTSLDENYAMIRETVRFLKENGKRVLFDAEHFFDGCALDEQVAFDALKAAVEGGADCLVLCDTNGGCFPSTVYDKTKKVCETFALPIGIHCHNDSGMAVACTVAAVEAGATHVQGTFLGYGERCGNANLSTIIANLQLKLGYTLISPDNMGYLTAAARSVAETSNISLRHEMPFVGSSAFAHKAGMHADGVIKASSSFEHIDPEEVGNERHFVMSEQSGRRAVLERMKEICPDLDKDSPQTQEILDEVKKLEHQGYQFDAASASCELIVRKHLGQYTPSFELVNYRILGEQPADTNRSSTATLKIKVDGQLQISAAEGKGPIHALDQALREALGRFYPCLLAVHMTDYKVRVMDAVDASAAKVRVLFTSSDGKREWTTVGASADIIEASWKALVDSIEYKLTFLEEGE